SSAAGACLSGAGTRDAGARRSAEAFALQRHQTDQRSAKAVAERSPPTPGPVCQHCSRSFSTEIRVRCNAPTSSVAPGIRFAARGFDSTMIVLFACTLFLSSTLLFLVQPMIAKMVLPLLGGTPAVWNTCMVFFQITLLLGYLYVHVITRWLRL